MTDAGRTSSRPPGQPAAGGAGPDPVGPSGAGTPGARAAGQRTVRRHNLALVLGEVARAAPVSRARVAERTGLTRGTVSSLVAELLEAGLVSELDAERGIPGRPANLLRLNRSGPAGLGIEIGVDHIGACVVDLTGAVRATATVPSAHRDRDPAAGLGGAAALAAEVSAEAGLEVIGATVALPGLVGPGGVLGRAPNLPRWVDVPVGARVSQLLGGLPVTVGNEADLAAMAELWFGAGLPDFVYVSAEFGVGAGIVLGGQLFRGAGGRAGELGHLVVDPRGPACGCGGRGCLEQAAGQEALLRAAGAADVADLLARRGRPRPAAAIAAAGRAIGIALAGAVNLLDVPAVVLGGLYARLGGGLLDAVRAQLRTRVLSGRPVTVACSSTGEQAALRAAATSVVMARLSRP